MQRLEAPPVRQEARCEPVEQLGMRRRLAEPPEVARRRNEAGPEVALPDSVHRDARDERQQRLSFNARARARL